MSSTNITIVGAGIAGAAVAQLLQRATKPTACCIYDRKAKPAPNPYGISLYSYACDRFLDALAHCSPHDEALKDILPGYQKASNETHNADGYRIHRAELENSLRKGLNVQWDQAVKNMAHSPENNGVTLQMRQEGTIYKSFIIIADGEHSPTRQALAPRSKLEVLPYVAYHGVRKLGLHAPSESYKSLFDHKFMSTRVKNTRIQLELVKDKRDNSPLLRYTYSRPARGSDDPLHKPNRTPDEAKDIPEAFFNELEQLRPSLSQPYHDALELDAVRKDRVLHWLMRKMVLDQEDTTTLSRLGVMLVGNAAHVEPIIGGYGANEALLDAVAVAEHIKTHGTTNLDEYYSSSRQRWLDGVARSEKRLAEMHGLNEPSPNL